MLQRVFFLLCFMGLLTACKVAVIVVEGGEVQSTASGTCSAGVVCVHQVNDANFTETFTAVAAPGWYFDKWSTGVDFICGQEPSSACLLSNVGTGGNAVAQDVIASDKTFMVMPRFLPAAPITDTITVASVEWAQVDLFLNLTWDDINAACPSGTCTSGAVLNGHDMSGWRWATRSEVGGLFQATTPHPGGIAHYSEIFVGDFQWADDFIDVIGFRETSSIPALQARFVSGYTSGPGTEPKANIERFVFPEMYASANTTGQDTSVASAKGAWFYLAP